jgi:hypothetical protein
MIISVVIFQSQHGKHPRYNKIRRRLPNGRNPVYFKSSSIAITQMKNGFRSSLILALNVTREVAQDRKFSRTSQLNSRHYPHQPDFHRQNHTDSAPRRLPWQTFIPSISKKGTVLAARELLQ